MRINNDRIEREIQSIPRACGVYLITYRPTGKMYIGASRNMRTRLRTHLYSITRSANHPMKEDVEKYGLDGISVSILEHIEHPSSLAVREQFWQDKLLNSDNAYNPSLIVKPDHTWIR